MSIVGWLLETIGIRESGPKLRLTDPTQKEMRLYKREREGT